MPCRQIERHILFKIPTELFRIGSFRIDEAYFFFILKHQRCIFFSVLFLPFPLRNRKHSYTLSRQHACTREFKLPSTCWATSLGLLFRLRHSQLTVLLLGVSGPKSEARSISLSGRTTGRTRPVPSAPLDGGLSPASLPLAEPMLRAVVESPAAAAAVGPQPICPWRVLAARGAAPPLQLAAPRPYTAAAGSPAGLVRLIG